MNILLWFIGMSVSYEAYAVDTDNCKEITLASEAAPQHIVENASFTKFVDGKFKRIKSGNNNFTCFAIREPKGRYEPSCLNEQAMRSVFYTYQIHMNLLFRGRSYAETYKAIESVAIQKALPQVEAGSLVYMMSPNNRNYDPSTGKIVRGGPHQMYFYPKLSEQTFSLPAGMPFLWQGFPNMSALIVSMHR